MHIIAVDEFVNSHGLLADAMQKGSRVAGQNLRDVCIAQHGMQTTNHRGQLVWWPSSACALDGFDGVADTVDAVADSMGKIAIEQKEFQNAAGRKIGCVNLAVRFE